jgi:hypothetical protein
MSLILVIFFFMFFLTNLCLFHSLTVTSKMQLICAVLLLVVGLCSAAGKYGFRNGGFGGVFGGNRLGGYGGFGGAVSLW